MATQEMTGTNKLAERILSDARADAAATLTDADRSAAAIRAEGEKKLTEQRAAFSTRREAAVKSILDGARTRAELDGRKTALKKKRAVIEQAFQKAYDKLLLLGDDARASVCLAMLTSEAEDGETVYPSKRDRAAVASAVKTFTKAKLVLADEDAALDSGFLLMGAGYEKNCSFASLMEELRSAEETDVAALLFGSREGQQ